MCCAFFLKVLFLILYAVVKGDKRKRGFPIVLQSLFLPLSLLIRRMDYRVPGSEKTTSLTRCTSLPPMGEGWPAGREGGFAGCRLTGANNAGIPSIKRYRHLNV